MTTVCKKHVLLCVTLLLLSSCHTSSSMLDNERIAKVEENYHGFYERNIHSFYAQPVLGGLHSHMLYEFSKSSKEFYTQWNEKIPIERILYRKAYTTPEKAASFDAKIQKHVVKMEKARDRRIACRQAFLQQFYTALYQDTPAAFTKKYRKYCTEDVLNRLALYYRLNHGGQKGYMWAIFGDNTLHSPEDIVISHIQDFDLNNTAGYGNFMFKEVKKEDYPYSWADGFWYKVRLGGYDTFVQVKGEGRLITITGLVNPQLDVCVRETKPEPSRWIEYDIDLR